VGVDTFVGHQPNDEDLHIQNGRARMPVEQHRMPPNPLLGRLSDLINGFSTH
jgi:hypothetical protein